MNTIIILLSVAILLLFANLTVMLMPRLFTSGRYITVRQLREQKGLTRIKAEIPIGLHVRLKSLSVLSKCSMRQLIVDMLEKYLNACEEVIQIEVKCETKPSES